MKKENIIELLLLVVVIVSVAAVPLAIAKINHYYSYSKFPKNSQIITLYGIAKGGIWTQEPVTAWNYWWKKFKRADEITIRDDGTPIFFRLTSIDVVHSFSVPLYRLGPYDVKPGKFKEIELKTNRQLRSTRYLCYQYCDNDHQNMYGKLIIQTNEE